MANEIVALAQVGADAIDRLAITPAQTLHAGIARRVFSHVGVASAPTRMMHDRIATAAYSATRFAVRGAAGAVASSVPSARGDLRPISNSTRGRFFIGALNGLTGDRLVDDANELAIEMAVRHNGRDVASVARELTRAFPGATPRLAVLLHGLGGTDEWWQRPQRSGRRGTRRPFGASLRQDAGFTPVYIRYNSGLRISQNGARLSRLLEQLCAAWPVPVDELALIGHSMGGLVIRSAGQAGIDAGHSWPARTRHIVTLGTPHHGAPLAKAVHAAAWALRALPETVAMAEILDTRSAGIRDLRVGALHDDDWRAEDARDFADRRRTIPLLPACRHTFITATVTANPSQPVGYLLGDLLVRTESASGHHRERLIPVDPGSVVHVGGLTHIDLLDHPLVYGVLRDVLRSS